MKILIRNEIKDFFEEVCLDLRDHIHSLLERADYTNFPAVNFNHENSMVYNIETDQNTMRYLSSRKLDEFDMLEVSSMLCDGFIKLIRGYYSTIEKELSN